MTAPDGPSPPGRRRGRRVAIAVLVVGGATLLALAVGEAVVRVMRPQKLLTDLAAVWEPVDGLGRTRRANLDIRVNTGEREVRVLTDGRGHRIGTTTTPRGDVRILAVGDSFVEALQVEHEETMTSRLEGLLSASRGRAVSVVNTSAGGWAPNQYLLATCRELERDRYHLVLVVVYLQNDLIDRRVDRFAPRSAPPPTLGRRAQLALHRHSHLYAFVYNLVEALRIRSGARQDHLLKNILRSEVASRRWRVTADVLADLAEVVRRRGADTLFVLIPTKHWIDERALATSARIIGIDVAELDVGQAARLLTAEMTARGLRTVDATPSLKAARTSGTPVYGDIDAHFNAAGHRVVAALLSPILQQAMLGERRPPPPAASGPDPCPR